MKSGGNCFINPKKYVQVQTFTILRPSKLYPKLVCWYATVPSGTPALYLSGDGCRECSGLELEHVFLSAAVVPGALREDEELRAVWLALGQCGLQNQECPAPKVYLQNQTNGRICHLTHKLGPILFFACRVVQHLGRIYNSYIRISVAREERGEREAEAGELIKLIKTAMDGILWRCTLHISSLSPLFALFAFSPLNLVTLEYTKKYDPYIYDFVYTPVTTGDDSNIHFWTAISHRPSTVRLFWIQTYQHHADSRYKMAVFWRS
jgi:hypothetical protein